MAQKQMSGKTPRPYIKPSMKLDLHTDENKIVEAKEAVAKMAAYLVANGYRRSIVKRRRTKAATARSKQEQKIDVRQEEKESMEVETASSKAPQGPPMALFGLRSVIRTLNNLNEPNVHGAEEFVSESTGTKLAALCLDADMLEMSSAVSNLFGLAALSGTGCPFFSIPQLSTLLASELNLPRCSALGLLATMRNEQEGATILSTLLASLRPIGTSPKQPIGEFITPTLHTPKGKAGKKKRPKKKKKRTA